MDVLHERCAGLDISKKDVKACMRTPGTRRNQRHSEVRTFGSTTNALLALRDWLIGERVSLVVMEATSDYWKPVFYLLEDALNVELVNAAHAKGLPGRKSDVADSVWLCQMAECGLLRGSFVPPPPIRAMRDLTRYRAVLTAERTREAQRLEKDLEDSGIKLSSIATNILGVSARAMLAALINGQRDPAVLAQLARGRMRAKLPELNDALLGRFSEHHAFLCSMHLRRVDELDADIAEVDTAARLGTAPRRQRRQRIRRGSTWPRRDDAILRTMRDPFTASFELRRRYVSDRTWSGAAFVAIGYGMLTEIGGWLRLVGLTPLVAGAALIHSGVRRALNRTDPRTGETRPSPPW